MGAAEPVQDQPGPPLAGTIVVALEQAVAAPLCSRHLADLGAEVIKVEHPDGGDFARAYDSVVHGASTYFVWLNRGKRSVALDLKRPDDRDLLDRLVASADVFLHNLGPGAVDRLGLDWGSIHRRWPRLISCAISGYGPDGPYRSSKAFDLLIQGESGLISVTGTADAPAKVGISIADISAGMYALTGILAALNDRSTTGKGRAVEVSMLDCLAEWMTVPLYHELYGAGAPARAGTHHATIAPYGPFTTSDDEVVLIAVQNHPQWYRLCIEVAGLPALVDDPRFASNEERVRHREALDALLAESLRRFNRDSLVARLEEANVPFGFVNDVRQLANHPQLAARGRWIDDGAVRALRPPFGLAGLVDPPGAVPALGEATEEFRRRLGKETREPA